MTAPATTTIEEGRPSIARLLWQQLRYANTGYWRTPIAAFFTLVFPLVFLLLIGMLAGNEVIDPGTGLRFAQFLTPAMVVFGAAMATFSMLPITVAVDRDAGVLKRLHGTPLPPRVYLTARVLFSTWTALLGTALVVAVGVVFYDVQIVWSKAPAAVLTLLVGSACLASLGMVIAALVSREEAVSAVANGVLIPMAFISGIFTAGQLPDVLDRISLVLPLRHFFEALSETFNPYTPGAGFEWGSLGVLLLWMVAGVVVATRWFRWENRATVGRRTRRARRAGAGRDVGAPAATDGATTRGADVVATGRVEEGARPAFGRLLLAQIRHASALFWRSRATAFFAVGFPIILVIIIPQVFGTGTIPDRGVPTAQVITPVMAVYGLAAATYLFLATTMARARERGILKRIHGTPLPVGTYIAGQVAGAVGFAVVTLVLVVLTGVVVYDVEIVWSKVPALLVYVVLGVACFSALGMALAGLARNERAADTLANVTLLPLAFVSDIFIIGDLPRALDVIGWIFPLKHLANAVAGTFNPTVAGFGWHAGYLLALIAWLVVGVLAALRFFSWSPRGERG
jgi:ABC-2 type transport system permease protein